MPSAWRSIIWRHDAAQTGPCAVCPRRDRQQNSAHMDVSGGYWHWPKRLLGRGRRWMAETASQGGAEGPKAE